MTIKEGSTQIPENAIKGAVGGNTRLSIKIFELINICDKLEKPNKKNSKMSGKGDSRPLFVTELEAGMSIPADVTTENQRKKLREAMSKEEQQK